MRIYFDESGNTGCLTRDGRETYRGKDAQSLYALGAVLPADGEDAALFASYKAFKGRCGAEGQEVKGSDLLTRDRNGQLADFVETFLARGRIKVCLYSKDFYLATALMQAILGPEAKTAFPRAYYSEASNLALFGEESLKAYAGFSDSPNERGARLLVERLLEDPDGVLAQGGFLHFALRSIEEEGRWDLLLGTDVVAGGYAKPSYQNLVNLSAFGELLAMIKSDEGVPNAGLELVHDGVREFEDEYLGALDELGVRGVLRFEESADCLGVQLADNVASIVGNTAKKVTACCRANAQWESANEWVMALWSKLLDLVCLENLKLVVPLQDQAMLLSAALMFEDGFPSEYRSNLVFNELYCENLDRAVAEAERAGRCGDERMLELLRM